MSSIFSSSLSQASTAAFSKICTAYSALFLMNAGVTISMAASLEMNSQRPSEAITMNLSSEYKRMYLWSLSNT